MAGLIRRGSIFYAVYRVGGSERRVSLGTDSFQVAKAKVRQMEAALYQGDPTPLPTKTPIGQIVAAYIDHMKVAKTVRSALKDSYYLREMFGPICPALEVLNPRIRAKALARRGPGRRTAPKIEANCLEQITRHRRYTRLRLRAAWPPPRAAAGRRTFPRDSLVASSGMISPTHFETVFCWVIYAGRAGTVRPSAGRKHRPSRSEGKTWKEGVNPRPGSVTLPQPGAWRRDETAVHTIARRGKTP